MTINGFPNESMDQLKKCQTMQTTEFCASIDNDDDDADVDGPCNWIRIYIQLANDCANKVDFIC